MKIGVCGRKEEECGLDALDGKTCREPRTTIGADSEEADSN